MGEKELEKVAAVAKEGGKKEEEAMAVVLKLELHCEGCAKKVRRSISQLKGIEKVKADCNAKKLMVTGNVDPTWLRETVEAKTKKKVELISPLPTKDNAGNGGAAADNKAGEDKADGMINKKPKEAAVVNTVVMKTKLHCDGCAHKIKRIISKNFDGVELVTTDIHRDLITVIGTTGVDDLVAYLREKLKRGVDIIAPKKDDDKKGKNGNNDGDKKDKSSSQGEEKKQDEKKVELKPEISGGENNKDKEKTKMEVSKMEHHSYNIQTHYAMPMHSANHDRGESMYHHHQGYPNMDHMIQYTQGPPLPPPTFVNMNNDHMFSDENPNGCFIM